mmetsp:Transcript_32149/g.91202  ORF Transcript_32149/g.91202 Transcript_32149/m.91202 type:complete len:623 (-) Transcript_32149:250-2118(-)|eukprot:CAMPEP_0117652032 /NCGR_PEP_ID=MMETSP0804-20121206/2412_1 /TAXON_ID=1074897 /ORGANISM="Tetraselmis astigmatica, Strain CCMP880" /LENGTH=622 /DNA_ID=CAMNT_0005458055 /DNA_START=69 /DNA_END=1940 /DNA_ORIENTATION=-
MATKPGVLYEWPWAPMGDFKYLLFTPFVAAVALGKDDGDHWALHMLIITALRYVTNYIWIFASRCDWISGKNKIQHKPVTFTQVDRENNWDDYIILQAIVMTAVHKVLPQFEAFPANNWTGLMQMLLLHAGPTEFIYYWLHRALHHHSLYSKYHSHHHASFVTEAITGSVHPFLEHICYTANFAIPLLGTWLMGGASWAMFYVYLLGFDFLNAWGHCNFEFFPLWIIETFPFVKYLIYTPTFHSLHHSHVRTNYCLFMPIYDYMYGTWDPDSDKLHAKSRYGRQDEEGVVFLAHGTELLSVFHLPFMTRRFSSVPFKASWAMYLAWPLTIPLMLIFWVFGKVFVTDRNQLGKLQMQTWCTPRFGFQYFLPFDQKRINRLIKDAIVKADKLGIQVIGLGALNKAEPLNGGGKQILDDILSEQELKVRVVHGNTLTAACVLKELPESVKEIFLTGSTSKLGRAIALYLSAKGTRVIMYTRSAERFAVVQSEAKPEHRHLLVHSTSFADGSSCKTWVVGTLLGAKEQHHAPSGAFFHQFVVPPITETRSDCTYGKLAAMRLPPKTLMRACEMTMERNCVHACHAGALVHALEGWDHHEVGTIDVSRIDTTWDAAMRHGFQPVFAA